MLDKVAESHYFLYEWFTSDLKKSLSYWGSLIKHGEMRKWFNGLIKLSLSNLPKASTPFLTCGENTEQYQKPLLSSLTLPSLRTGGRIDQAHHDGRAYMALHETVAFDNAIAKGLELTSEHETLTVVMADHSHPLSFNGFPFRGQSILGKYEL